MPDKYIRNQTIAEIIANIPTLRIKSTHNAILDFMVIPEKRILHQATTSQPVFMFRPASRILRNIFLSNHWW